MFKKLFQQPRLMLSLSNSYQARYSSMVFSQKINFEREVRAALAKLERAQTLIPDQLQQKKLSEDYNRFSNQFQELVFKEAKDENESQIIERDLKKLLTITKSKFYMLKINFPKQLTPLDEEITDQNTYNDELNHDPFANNPNIPKSNNIATPKPIEMKAQVEINEDESPENKLKKKELLEKDKMAADAMDKQTQELIKQMEVLKKIDKMNEGVIEQQKLQAQSIKYVDREESEELQKMYAEEQKRFEELHAKLHGKIDGQIDIDMHGNINIKNNADANQSKPTEGIQGSGTYVLRDGKLVEGKGETREQAQYSNWYCSNADPEDIRRHRELMDRMHYRGPKWEGKGVPKSVLEEYDPTYRKVEGEQHPSEIHKDKEGKKEFEYVVR